MSRTTYIYGLCDPRTGAIRYVGKGVDPEQRRLAHMQAAFTPRRTAKGIWLRELHDAGLTPELRILQVVDGDGHRQEREWIERVEDLLNVVRHSPVPTPPAQPKWPGRGFKSDPEDIAA